MSNLEITNEIVVGEKKPLKSLPAKYNKFAVFTFWLCEKLRQEYPEAVDPIINVTNLLSRDVPTQILFYDNFVSEEKINTKALRTIIMQKPKKEKLPKDTKNRKTRVSKKNNTVEQVTNNDIISQIVSRANSVESDTTAILDDLTHQEEQQHIVQTIEKKVVKEKKEKVVKDPKEKVVKEKKEKVVKEPKEKAVKEKVVKEKKEKVVKEPKEKAVKEPKEKVVKEKKEKVVKEPKEKVVKEEQEEEEEEEEEEEQEEEEEELQAVLVVIDGVQLYQDTKNGMLYGLDFKPYHI